MAKGVFGVSFLVFALSVFVLEAMRGSIVKVNGSVAYWAGYFGHGLSKCEKDIYMLALVDCLSFGSNSLPVSKI